MFSIPAAGVAKTLVAVTISLHSGVAHHSSHEAYSVRPGDTLSNIASHEYGKASDWPALWWANRHQVPNPSLITAGQRLRLPAKHQVKPWLAKAAAYATPASAPAQAAPAQATASSTSTSTAVSPSSLPSAGGVNWAAIAQCESGGNWSTNTGNGFYGGHLGCLRRRPVRRVRQRSQRVSADRRGPARARGPGHRRLAGLRRGRLTHPLGDTCLHRAHHGPGQAGDAVSAAHGASAVPASR